MGPKIETNSGVLSNPSNQSVLTNVGTHEFMRATNSLSLIPDPGCPPHKILGRFEFVGDQAIRAAHPDPSLLAPRHSSFETVSAARPYQSLHLGRQR